MEWSVILDYLMTLAPWVQYVFVVLGSLVVIGTAVDAVIPDAKDNGFMKKILATPIIGTLLLAVSKFSPFNVRS